MSKKYQVIFNNAIVATDWVRYDILFDEEVNVNNPNVKWCTKIKISVEQGYTYQIVERDPYIYTARMERWLIEKGFFYVPFPTGESLSEEVYNEYVKDFDELIGNTDTLGNLIFIQT